MPNQSVMNSNFGFFALQVGNKTYHFSKDLLLYPHLQNSALPACAEVYLKTSFPVSLHIDQKIFEDYIYPFILSGTLPDMKLSTVNINKSQIMVIAKELKLMDLVRHCKSRLHLFLKGLDNTKFSTDDLSEDSKVEEMKHVVVANKGIPYTQIKLLFSGQQLQDNKNLSEYSIKDDDEIEFIIRMTGD